MNNIYIKPFKKIAGVKALSYGFLSLVITVILSYLSGFHAHGLLQYGPANNDVWWCFAVERIIIWIIPATLCYIGGKWLSKSSSSIRLIDVYGTILFAQIPLLFMALMNLFPPMQIFNDLDTKNIDVMMVQITDLLSSSNFMAFSILSIISLVCFIWCIILMYNSLQVSCNLKGAKLNILFIAVVIIGDILSRFAINFTRLS